jgi:uncharacterized protein YecT (DUF1311 family)
MTRLAAFGFIFALAIAKAANAQTDEEVTALLTPTVRTCEHAPENGGTLEQAICYRDEAVRQDQQLNDLWTRVVSGSSLAGREALRRSERRWIKERDATCHQEAAAYINSTAAYMFNVCMTHETIRRILWLKKAGNRPDRIKTYALR